MTELGQSHQVCSGRAQGERFLEHVDLLTTTYCNFSPWVDAIALMTERPAIGSLVWYIVKWDYLQGRSAVERNRPGALTALAVIGIVLGSLTGLGGLNKMATLAFQDALQQMGQIHDDPRASTEVRQRLQRQQRMQEDIQEVQRGWLPIHWALAPTSILFGVFLIVGGALSLKLSRTGRKILIWTCVVGIAFDMARGTADIMMTLQISRVWQEHMTEMTAGTPGSEMASGMMGAAAGMGLAFGAAWVALKVGYYLWGVVYLTTDRMRDLYEKGISY